MSNLPHISPPGNQSDAEEREQSSTPRQSQSNRIRRDYLRIVQECKAQGKRFHRGNAKLRRKVNDEEARVQSELAPLEPPPSPENTAHSIRRGQHRRQHRSKSTDPDDEADDPPDDYPAPSAWGQDPALDDGWGTPAPEYQAHTAALDSLHQPAPTPVLQHPLSCIYRHEELRPDAETLIPWDLAKASSLELAERLDRSTAALELSQKMRTCQHYLVFRPLVDGRWAISDTRRCNQRLCPNDALARARKLRPRIDRLAEQIGRHGQLVFATLKAGRCSPAELWAAWQRLRNQRPFRRAVMGYFVGLHLSRQLRPHLHAVLVVDAETNRARVPLRTVDLRYTPPELPAICHTRHAKAPLSAMWSETCRALSLPSPMPHFEAVHSPAQALQYIARPAAPALAADADLPALFAMLHNTRTLHTAGIVREYWTTDDGPDWLGGPGEARRYGWDETAYEITPPE